MSTRTPWILSAGLIALTQAVPGPQVSLAQTDVVEFHYYDQTPWFGTPAIRKQLKLDDDQYNRLHRSYVQQWTPYRKSLSTLSAELKEQERQRQLAGYYTTFHRDFYKTVPEVLTDPLVRTRYNQLHYQYLGYGAFTDPDVQERLRLTEAQRRAFNEYYYDWRKQMGTYAREYPTDRVGVAKRYGETWAQYRQRVNSTLTPEQLKTWNELIGEPYEVPVEVYFGARP